MMDPRFLIPETDLERTSDGSKEHPFRKASASNADAALQCEEIVCDLDV